MADFSKPPSSSQLTIKPFKAHVDQQAIDDFKTLLRLSPVSNATYENSHPSVAGPRRYGKFMGMSNAFIAFTPPCFLLRAEPTCYDGNKAQKTTNSYRYNTIYVFVFATEHL